MTSNDKLSRIWEEIAAQSKERQNGRQEGEITRFEFNEMTGNVLSDWQCKNQLKKLVDLGVLKVRRNIWVPELGAKVNLYSPVVK